MESTPYYSTISAAIDEERAPPLARCHSKRGTVSDEHCGSLQAGRVWARATTLNCDGSTDTDEWDDAACGRWCFESSQFDYTAYLPVIVASSHLARTVGSIVASRQPSRQASHRLVYTPPNLETPEYAVKSGGADDSEYAVPAVQETSAARLASVSASVRHEQGRDAGHGSCGTRATSQ
eukprot:6564486-Prymnesium_polylepis.1